MHPLAKLVGRATLEMLESFAVMRPRLRLPRSVGGSLEIRLQLGGEAARAVLVVLDALDDLVHLLLRVYEAVAVHARVQHVAADDLDLEEARDIGRRGEIDLDVVHCAQSTGRWFARLAEQQGRGGDGGARSAVMSSARATALAW